LSQDVVEEVRKHPTWGPKTLKTVIPRTVRVAEAPSYGKPVITFDPSSVGAKAYREAAKEIAAWQE
jgi:chromosome partitioning protein